MNGFHKAAIVFAIIGILLTATLALSPIGGLFLVIAAILFVIGSIVSGR